jgi:hypothetical protein
MKKLNVAPISDSAQMPLKKGTLQFLQLAYTEGIAALMQCLAGPNYDATVMYIVAGLYNIGNYPNYIITDGVVFYNGEFYLVDGAAFTSTGGDVAVLNFANTQYTTDADPVTFTDGVARNVHNIRKYVLSSAPAGSGNFDFQNLQRIVIPQTTPATQITTAGTPADNILQVLGSFPNFQLYVPPANANTPRLVWIGDISANGATVTPSYTNGVVTVTGVTKGATGYYTINHNIGNTKYYVDGVGRGFTFCSLRAMASKTNTAVTVSISDDASPNDNDFELRIYVYP